MTEKVRFDGPNKIIIVNDSETELDAGTDIYSAWKRWLHTNTISSSGGYSFGPSAAPAPVFQQALRTVGGDPIGGGKVISPYFFLVNNWRVRPFEGDHRLLVDGNIFVDGGGNPFIPTNGDYNVTVQLLTSTDSTSIIQQLEIKNLQHLIETTRTHHTGTGDIWYWDPFNGNDDQNEGTARDDAFKTFAKAHDMAETRNHDIIICVPGHPTEQTVSTEKLVITKDYLFVRGPGRDFKIKPTSPGRTVDITGSGVEVSSLLIETNDDGISDAINIRDCDFPLIKHVWFENSAGYSISVSGSDHTILDDCHMDYSETDGIIINDDIHDLVIKNCEINDSAGNGINIAGNNIHNVRINPTQIISNGKYGIYISPGASATEINVTSLSENVSGAIFDGGIATTYVGDLQGDRTKDKILDETLSLHTCAGSVADIVQQIRDLAGLVPGIV